uniref:Reverse transcriptase domain-containing protein n=1 Tax=Fagus sylvatica TaxID=28930 RepID=A0A2N9FU80_FAGSY
MGFVAALWLRDVLLEVAKLSNDQNLFRSFREGNKIFVLQKQRNGKGRFVKITALGDSKSKGYVIIPEGRDACGWHGLSQKIDNIMAMQNRGNSEVNQRRPQARQATAQGNQVPNMVKESRTFKEAVTQGDMANMENIAIGIAENQEVLSQRYNDSAKQNLEISLRIVLSCGPNGVWEVRWAGVEPCETMGPSHSQAHESIQPANRATNGSYITNGKPKAQPVTVKAKTQPNDLKPKMVWQPRVNGSQIIKRGAEAGTASTTVNLSHDRVSIQSCDSDSQILSTPSFILAPPTISIAEDIQKIGEVDRSWGSSRDWFIDLRDGRRLRIPVDLRSSVTVLSQPEDAITQKLVNWVKSQREASGSEIDDDMGDLEEGGLGIENGFDSVNDLSGSEVVVSVEGNGSEMSMGLGEEKEIYGLILTEKLDGDWNELLMPEGVVDRVGDEGQKDLVPLNVKPPAVAFPDGVASHGVQATEIIESQTWDWVQGRQKAIGKVLGANYEGYEQAVIVLLMDIEARHLQRKASMAGLQKPMSSGRKGSRELKRLASSINYEARATREDKGKGKIQGGDEIADIICLQETKLELITDPIVRSLWRCRYVDWLFLGSSGASGGILLMWDSRVVEKIEGAVGYFSVSCKFKNVETHQVCMFTGVYGPNINSDRRLMWDELAGIRSWWDVPWCLGGDFNVVRFPTERMGSANFSTSMHDFSDFISSNGLIDIPLTGGDFTWSNNRECGNLQRRRRPFRFENMWLKAEGFVERVRSWWESYQVEGTPSFVFANKLKALKVDLKKWNETEFGNVNVQKKTLLAGLREIDTVADSRPLSAEEKSKREQLAIDLEKVILRAEICWRQKSRALWLKEGDKNSRFFHCIASSHRNTNTIGKLLINGSPSMNQDEIQDHIAQFYEHLPFEESEIESVVQGCNGDKAPGPDGFSLAFFQSCWSVVRSDVLGVCQEFHGHCQFERSLNATFVSLIPKKHGADELKDFRPISLVGGMYKIIAKLLANRLAVILGKIISPSQSAFVKGRQILDSVLIANECLDSRLKASNPGVLCKLDLEKAYDHVNWDFLIYLLRRCGFSEKWRHWIYFCISSVRFSILINGSPCGFFPSSRGIRQRDPLSPMLFVIVMEAFSRLIVKANGAGMLSGFSVGSIDSDPLEVSHLLFADDTLIFCEADPDHLFHLHSVLIWFEATSGLRVNLGKSELVPVGEVPDIEELVDTLGCKTSKLPMKYLGLPLGAKFKAKDIWNPIVEKMERRLVADVAHRIEKIQGNFLWGLLRRWPNFTWLSGTWFGVERDAFWRKVIMVKYGSLDGGWMSKAPSGPHGVGLWKFIQSRWVKFSKLVTFEVGDGSLIRFWDDVWCGEEPLKLAYPELYRITYVKDGQVADYVHCRGHDVHWEVTFTRSAQDWELESISSLELLYSVKIQSSEKDKMCWKPARSKGFQVKSFYTHLSSPGLGLFLWKGIWKAKVPPRVAFFAWTAALGKILTADNLRHRGIPVVSWCCMCKADGETVDHLLLHCPYAKELWDMVFGLFGIQWVMPKRVIDLFPCWIGSVGRTSVIWKAIPHCIMWCLWRERNARTFEDCELSVVELKLHFYRSLLDWMSATGLFRLSNMLDLIDYCSF